MYLIVMTNDKSRVIGESTWLSCGKILRYPSLRQNSFHFAISRIFVRFWVEVGSKVNLGCI